MGRPDPKATVADLSFMRDLAAGMAAHLGRPTQTPFGSDIVETATGKHLLRRLNAVAREYDTTSHAKVRALRAATKKLKKLSLKGYTLYTTCEPCPMCMAAALWAGVDRVVFNPPYTGPRRGALLSDYTWNHTTLWALEGDPMLTYLQCGFDAKRAREQMHQLKEKFGDDILYHIEFAKSSGVVGPGSIPIIRFTTEERLQEIIDYCGQIGVGVANPHINHLEGSGRWRSDAAELVAKTAYDPRGLLNPGKMIGFKPVSASEPQPA